MIRYTMVSYIRLLYWWDKEKGSTGRDIEWVKSYKNDGVDKDHIHGKNYRKCKEEMLCRGKRSLNSKRTITVIINANFKGNIWYENQVPR